MSFLGDRNILNIFYCFCINLLVTAACQQTFLYNNKELCQKENRKAILLTIVSKVKYLIFSLNSENEMLTPDWKHMGVHD